mgnify:FL=1
MRNMSLWSTIFAVALPCCRVAAADPVQAQTATIAGTCTDAETRLPIVGAQVRVIGPALAAPVSPRTGDDGTYRAEHLPTGTVAVTCEADGHQPFTRAGVLLRAERTSRVNIDLLPREWSSNDAADHRR